METKRDSAWRITNSTTKVPKRQNHINGTNNTPKLITRNSDTKGNDANDELPAHNAINYSKNDCTIAPVTTTNTKNYDAENDDKHQELRR